MNKKVVLAGKIAAIAFGYSLVLFLAVFFTVSLLVKGEEVSAPDLTGMPLQDAYAAAARKGVYLKKIVGDFGGTYAPNTVVSQFPAAQTSVKEKSVVKIFVASEVGQTVVPQLVGLGQKESEALLKKSKLKKDTPPSSAPPMSCPTASSASRLRPAAAWPRARPSTCCSPRAARAVPTSCPT